MTIGSLSKKSKLIIGWHEWCSLPDLGLPGINAKIDTGAKTSSLHAYKIKPFTRDGANWVKFLVHPIQRHRHPEIECEAQVVDQRAVTSSNGTTETRYVINTTLILGAHHFLTEITLTNRDEMGYRMLIGRQSLSQRFVVDSSLSHTSGEYEKRDLYPAFYPPK
jgi:ribosomal protein S6--L-glutamate ligase